MTNTFDLKKISRHAVKATIAPIQYTDRKLYDLGKHIGTKATSLAGPHDNEFDRPEPSAKYKAIQKYGPLLGAYIVMVSVFTIIADQPSGDDIITNAFNAESIQGIVQSGIDSEYVGHVEFCQETTGADGLDYDKEGYEHYRYPGDQRRDEYMRLMERVYNDITPFQVHNITGPIGSFFASCLYHQAHGYAMLAESPEDAVARGMRPEFSEFLENFQSKYNIAPQSLDGDARLSSEQIREGQTFIKQAYLTENGSENGSPVLDALCYILLAGAFLYGTVGRGIRDGSAEVNNEYEELLTAQNRCKLSGLDL